MPASVDGHSRRPKERLVPRQGRQHAPVVPRQARGLVPTAGGLVPTAGGLVPTAGGLVPTAGGLVGGGAAV